MFLLLGLSIMLMALLVLNNAASLLALLVWRSFRARINRWPAQRSAQTLFWLTTLPAALSIGGVLFLFVPAYLRHESRVGHEDISTKLALLAALSTVGIVVAIVRGIATWRATNRFTALWLRNAVPIQLPNLDVPAYQIEHSFPLIAIVGASRQRLFIAQQVFETLTPAELAAALAHENAHVLAHDNLRRIVARVCRDLAFIPVAKDLERAWLAASEAAADEVAARRDRRIGLDLASAIVKIARMIPAGASPAMTAGAFLANEDGASGFRSRISRLISLPQGPQQARSNVRSISRRSLIIPAALTLIVFVLSSEAHILSAIHNVIEHAVYVLK